MRATSRSPLCSPVPIAPTSSDAKWVSAGASRPTRPVERMVVLVDFARVVIQHHREGDARTAHPRFREKLRVLVTARLIDEIEREPWRRPRLVKTYSPSDPGGGFDVEIEDEAPESGSADEVRQLVASRVVLLHSEDLADREAMIVLAEKHGIPWLLDRWMPGLLADWKRVGPRIVRLSEVIETLRTPPDRRSASDVSRRERLRCELMDIDRRLVGLTLLTDRPELLVCGAGPDSPAVREAERSEVRWVASEDVNDDSRFMRCAVQCAAAAREDDWPQRWEIKKLVDPMIPRPGTVPVNWAELGPPPPPGSESADQDAAER